MRRAFALVLLAGCPAGKAAQTVQPSQPKVGDADASLKTPSIEACKTAERADLMVVDWTPEMRSDIEAAMKEGVALVHYDCKTVKLEPACTLPGEYGYIGVTRREKTITMNSKDEVEANLPVGGISWLSDLGAKLGRESVLAAQIVTVGKRSSAKKVATRSELTGSCETATHFVRAATLGAFAVATGSKAELGASAKILGKGASAGSANETSVKAQDGNIENCQNASPDDKGPVTNCGAIVRIELEPIGAADAKPTPPAEILAVACPPGMFASDGACRRADVPHECKLGDGADCEKQCTAGDAKSCATLAVMYRDGTGVTTDRAKAASLAQQACEKDGVAGCRLAGAAKLEAKDAQGGRSLLLKACLGGDGRACVDLGIAKLADKALAGEAQYEFRRACYGGGEFEGCTWLGTLHTEGKGGLTANPKIGAKFFEKGCKEGSARACTALGDLYKSGKGVTKDAAKAKQLFEQACNAGDDAACKRK